MINRSTAVWSIKKILKTLLCSIYEPTSIITLSLKTAYFWGDL
jgi:hypothetical protein